MNTNLQGEFHSRIALWYPFAYISGMDTAKQIIFDIQERLGITDSEIARQCKTSQPTIWRIKNDAIGSCSADLYISLAMLRKRLMRRRLVAKSAA